MKKKVYLLPALLATSGLAMAAGTADERISALEKEVRLFKNQYAKSEADSIKVNGFFSFGMTQADNDLGYADATDEYSFEEFTILGLQANASLGGGRSVTTQMLAKGNVDDFAPKVSWAYLSQAFDNGGTARVGKLRVPLFAYSDFLDVGISQPWIRPVEEVYGNIGFDTYFGGDYSYDFELEDSTMSFQTFTGLTTSDVSDAAGGGELSYDDLYGASLAWTNDTLTLRAIYGAAKLEASDNDGLKTILGGKAQGNFYGIGLNYDDGSLLIASEFTRTEVEGTFSDVDSIYATIGYRIDAWTPYMSVATFETQDNDERTAIIAAGGTTGQTVATLNAERTATSIGTRYDIASNISLKTDVTVVDGFGDTVGLLFNSTGLKESTIYSVRIDSVF